MYKHCPRVSIFTSFRSTMALFQINEYFCLPIWYSSVFEIFENYSFKIVISKFQKVTKNWENSGQVWKLLTAICRRSVFGIFTLIGLILRKTKKSEATSGCMAKGNQHPKCKRYACNRFRDNQWHSLTTGWRRLTDDGQISILWALLTSSSRTKKQTNKKTLKQLEYFTVNASV